MPTSSVLPWAQTSSVVQPARPPMDKQERLGRRLIHTTHMLAQSVDVGHARTTRPVRFGTWSRQDADMSRRTHGKDANPSVAPSPARRGSVRGHGPLTGGGWIAMVE